MFRVPGPAPRRHAPVRGVAIGLPDHDLFVGLRRVLRAASALALALLLVAPAGASGLPEDMEGRVAPCTLCHGAQGRSASDGYYPRIAGKPREYLFNQLVAFRDGGRQYAPMRRLLAGLDDAYLADMAAYFAGLDLPYPSPQAPEASRTELERGRKLVHEGIEDGPPACVACHGERLTGIDPAIPGLLGLPRDYINAQIGAWREGQRRAGDDDCMVDVVKALDPADVRAISNWLASRPVPEDSHPAAGPPPRAALDCGVVARAGAAASRHARPGATATSTPTAGDPLVEKGRYLARIGNCESCHTRAGGAPWAGGRAIQTPFGDVYSSNLTSSREHGLGAWSFEDFRRAMREGVAPDGRVLSPAFPYTSFTRMHEEDLEALFAYLQTIDPVEEANRPARMRAPFGSPLALRAWRAIYFDPGELREDSSRSAQWNRGAYLVRAVAHCDQCHSPRDRLGGQADPESLVGARLPDGWHAPDLRDAAWTAAGSAQELADALRTGRSANGWSSGPMVEVVSMGTSHLTPEDALAIATYLVEDAVPREHRPAEVAPNPATLARGERIYRDRCADCHGDDGEGKAGRAPALAGNPGVRSPVADNLLRVILEGGYGAQTAENPRPYGMPPYGAELGDADIAAVATFIRHAWGNLAGEVRQSQVARLHAATP